MRLVCRPRLSHSMYFFSRTIGAYFPFALGLVLFPRTTAPEASRASRSALRRSWFLENAFCAISCSVIAFSASTCRNALRASRSALLIGLCSTSPGLFVISLLPSAPALQAGGWLRGGRRISGWHRYGG